MQLDTSANSATYVTTLDPLPNLLNLCPFLNVHSIDVPAEPDTLAAASLSRPGDVLDNWQVELNVPGIKGELSQDHNGGIIVTGGNYGCKITIVTRTKPGKIIICKQSLNGTGSFNFTGDLGPFSISTQSQNGGWSYDSDSSGCGQQCVQDKYSGPGPDSSSWTDGNKGDDGCDGDIDNSKDSSGHSYGLGLTNYNSEPDNSGSGNYQNNSQNGFAEKVFDNLNPGSYSVSESSQAGWDLTALTCSDPDNKTIVNEPAANIQLASGETVVCKFTNAKKKGSIIIQKHSVGGDGTFSFGGDLGSFNLQTANSTASKTFGNLAAGSYSVSENSLTGWKFTSLTCSDPNNKTTVYDSSAKIKLSDGETVTCVFTNTKKSKIVIYKKTGDDNDNCSFSGDLGSFNVPTSGGNGDKIFDNLDSGSYHITESPSGKWSPNSVICAGTGGTITGKTGVTLQLGPGQTVDCTFSDTKQK